MVVMMVIIRCSLCVSVRRSVVHLYTYPCPIPSFSSSTSRQSAHSRAQSASKSPLPPTVSSLPPLILAPAPLPRDAPTPGSAPACPATLSRRLLPRPPPPAPAGPGRRCTSTARNRSSSVLSFLWCMRTWRSKLSGRGYLCSRPSPQNGHMKPGELCTRPCRSISLRRLKPLPPSERAQPATVQ